MYYQPRNPAADATFIEAGGLKSWGCFAFLLSVLVLVILFFIVHALLSHLLVDRVAWWASLLVLIGVMMGAGFLWRRGRRRQRIAQEQAWQQAMDH